MVDENIVKIGLSDATMFKDCINTVNSLVAETKITLDEMGFNIVCIDPANVCLLAFKMAKSEFVEWTVSADTTFAIKVSDIKSALGRTKDKDTAVYLQLADNRLTVTLMGKNGKKKEFILPTLDLEDKEQKMPDLKDFTATVTMDNAELKDGIADVAIVAEAIEFNVANKKFSVAGAGDILKANSEMEANVSEQSKDGKPVAFKSKYSIEYLNKIVACKVSKNVKIQLAKDYPLKCSYINDKGTISMALILAPRMSND